MSLNDVYEIGFKHALEQITRNGGKINGNNVTIAVQKTQPVKLEQSFVGHFPPGNRTSINKDLKDEYTFNFEGNGFVVTGETAKWDSKSD
ncbi:hypothetical protein [Adhaeribacter radiodurans]|uniref:hypothetical protein n=1 Tax=Adhaeribacter radiodurans TaxID=2745197 RepID=UPI00293BD38C|nr:hypothetical protein [Adhaeribacter radiodurans]